MYEDFEGKVERNITIISKRSYTAVRDRALLAKESGQCWIWAAFSICHWKAGTTLFGGRTQRKVFYSVTHSKQNIIPGEQELPSHGPAEGPAPWPVHTVGDPGKRWFLSPERNWVRSPRQPCLRGAGLETARGPFNLNHFMILQFIKAADQNCTDRI